MIHIYYGKGRGKTSILNGTALRAAGNKMKVLYIPFLKQWNSAEYKILTDLGVEIWKHKSNSKFTNDMSEDELKQLDNETSAIMKRLWNSYKDYDVIMLDEFLDCIDTSLALINEEDASKLISEMKAHNIEVLISGHSKIKPLWKQADLISNVKKVRHYFDKGVQARKGIEW